MIEITGNDIADLNDTDLRILIGRLCEADAWKNGFSTAAITYGGDQDAPDGGIDVRTNLPSSFPQDGYIPRPLTGFQVKKSNMQPSDIRNEMSPKGNLRVSITELSKANGAYIIVSSSDDTSDSEYQRRLSVMKEALSGSEIRLDFYDRNRVANWVRTHPSIILWVRQKIGKPIQGWKPYDNWSNSPGGVEEDYLADPLLRFRSDSIDEDGLSVLDGIQRLRKKLDQPKSSIRLVGLSGVGKTRLLQALFDEKIGENALNRSLVFYTDLANDPNPEPLVFVEQLIALKQKFILAIDNCPSELHRKLTSVCSAVNSLGSLITVEYDIREDQPDDTDVFKLEPSSNDLIAKLLSKHFEHISHVNIRNIAEFSGGNARMAFALAKSIGKGEKIGELRDEDLFERLFYQRNHKNANLLKSAEVCSLVYSFDSQTEEGKNLELALLSKLANKSVNELYEDIAELKRRELIQQRHIWRAVLPHAIANKLAIRALEDIPINQILDSFVKGNSDRLLRSFTRRLNFLHHSNIAKQIVRNWFLPDGILGDLHNLTDNERNLLWNIAPVDYEITLKAIERAAENDPEGKFTTRANESFWEITRILRSIAYYPETFDRCVNLLCRFAISEDPEEKSNSVRDLLKSLFFLRHSGTHASANQRLDAIKKLVNSKDEKEQKLGLLLLRSTLDVSSSGTFGSFDFGAHVRDYGYYPKTNQDLRDWYALFLNYAIEVHQSLPGLSAELRKIVSDNFRGLWRDGFVIKELEIAAEEFSKSNHWSEGWISVQNTIGFDRKNMPTDILSRLRKLEERLRPSNPLDKARMFLFAGNRWAFAYFKENKEGDQTEEFDSVQKALQETAKEISDDYITLEKIIHEILLKSSELSVHFGIGLATDCKEPLEIWNLLCKELESTDSKDYAILCGFLSGMHKSNPELVNQFLDEALDNKLFAEYFPILQLYIELDLVGLNRLYKAIDNGRCIPKSFWGLAYTKIKDEVSEKEICNLLRRISKIPNEQDEAIYIFRAKLANKTINKSTDFIALGRELISKIEFNEERTNKVKVDFDFNEIVKLCVSGKEASDIARVFFEKIASALIKGKIRYEDCHELLLSCASMHPKVFMDTFISEDDEFNFKIGNNFIYSFGSEINPLTLIKDEIILKWCLIKPESRVQIIASLIPPCERKKDEFGYKWTTLSGKLLEIQSDPIMLLEIFKRSIGPKSWSGSLSRQMEERIGLFSDLKLHKDRIISSWAAQEEILYAREIQREKLREQDEHFRDQAFE